MLRCCSTRPAFTTQAGERRRCSPWSVGEVNARRVGPHQRISAAIRAWAPSGLQPLTTSVHASRLRAAAVVNTAARAAQPDLAATRREADGLWLGRFPSVEHARPNRWCPAQAGQRRARETSEMIRAKCSQRGVRVGVTPRPGWSPQILPTSAQPTRARSEPAVARPARP